MAERARWREWWSRLAVLTIPKMVDGPSTRTATTRGFIGYARDAAFLLEQSRDVHQAAMYLRAPDWSAFWDAHPECLLLRLEAWHAAREADGWSFEHAGEKQPGEWQKMPRHKSQEVPRG